MNAKIGAVVVATLLAASSVAQGKVCWDGTTVKKYQPCRIRTTLGRPTILPTDKTNLTAYKANLDAFRDQAVADRAAGKLAPTQYAQKMQQYKNAVAELAIK